MNTVVITGSSRGLGFELAKQFRQKGWNVVINGYNQAKLYKAEEELKKVEGAGAVLAFGGSVSNLEDMKLLAKETGLYFGKIDIWVNNAGVNQPMKPLWELEAEEMIPIIDTDLIGAMYGSKVAMQTMIPQGSGAIYNIEGYGSNDAMMTGLNLYGTAKRAVTHFTQALAKESEELKTGVIIGRLSPGMMATDFLNKALDGAQEIALPEKTKNVYNILADYPDVVAEFLVEKMIDNKKNDAHIEWLTTGKVAKKFITSKWNKKDLFED